MTDNPSNQDVSRLQDDDPHWRLARRLHEYERHAEPALIEPWAELKERKREHYYWCIRDLLSRRDLLVEAIAHEDAIRRSVGLIVGDNQSNPNVEASGLVERVAEAIGDCKAEGQNLYTVLASARAEGVGPEDVEGFLRIIARSAIAAMREPTAAMIDAAYDTADLGFCDEPRDPLDPCTIWEAMIEESLK